MKNDHLESHVAQAQRQLRELADALPDILRRGAAGSAHPDGLNRTGGGGGRSTSIADPTGNAATANPVPDDVDVYVTAIAECLDAACGKINTAVGWHRLLKATEAEKGRQSRIVECANPWCADMALPRPKSGRCSRCYTHRLAHGHDWKPAEGMLSEQEQARCVRCEQAEAA